MNEFKIVLPSDKKQLVVWGTGFVAKELIGRLKNEIAFFVDNDANKWGNIYLEKMILNPNNINKWKDYYIIIAVKNSSSIEQQLKGYGLEQNLDYERYYDSVPLDDFTTADDVIQLYFEKMQSNSKWKKSCILLNPAMKIESWFIRYSNNWSMNLKNINFGYLEEPGSELLLQVEKGVDLFTAPIPFFLSENIYSHSKEPSKLSNDVVAYVESDKNLYEAAKIMRKKHMDAQPLHEYGCIYYYYLYFSKVVEWAKPKCVIILNTMGAYHSVAKYVCGLQNVSIIRWEHGVLPGTYTLDTLGEMGKSAPAVYAKEFTELPISDEDFLRAGKIWNYIRESKINRKIQWQGNLCEIKAKLDKNNPTIFVAGQNDEASGMYPYTEDSKKFHSPIFASSMQAAIALGKLAKKNNWNIIYKSHPYIILSKEDRRLLPENVIIAEEVGVNYLIELADVVVTIVSQTAYMALLHDTPVLMLGYIQLRDKGCTYQAFEEKDIEKELIAAVENGFTAKQREAFQKHIAQLVKYYLYDNYED